MAKEIKDKELAKQIKQNPITKEMTLRVCLRRLVSQSLVQNRQKHRLMVLPVIVPE